MRAQPEAGSGVGRAGARLVVQACRRLARLVTRLASC